MLQRNDLYKYQRKLIDFIKRNPKCAAWVDMGLGKTVSLLTAFSDLLGSFDARHMLLVAPLRVARDVWHSEVEAWAHLNHLSVSRIVGTRKQRLKTLSVPADIHTINRENLPWLFGGYVQEITKNRFKQIRKWPWDCLGLDESQSFKNAGASRTLAASRISTFQLADRIIELTGTPSPNGYRDVWSQMYILDHGKRLGITEKDFLNRWFTPPREWGLKWTIKDHAPAEIQNQLRDIVISMQAEDYLDLPPVMYNPIYVTLSPAVMRKYKKLERDHILKLDTATINAVNAGVVGGKLLQLASGAMYTDDKGNFEVLHDSKLEALTDALDELSFSGPVLIGYGFKSDAKRIAARLEKYAPGQWQMLKSAESMRAFAAGEIDHGLIHPASAGHGLNDLYLSGSENIIWFGPTNNLEWWLQLIARIAGGHRRIGKNVRIQTILARDTVDEDYMQMLIDKDVDQTKFVRSLAARIGT